jgi:cold shock CspA family protein
MAFDCDFLTPGQRSNSRPNRPALPANNAERRRFTLSKFGFMARQIEGAVKHWRGEFGFIIGEDGADYFLHSRECLKSGIAFPRFGDRISFTPERGPKGLRAVGVRYATESA